MINLRSLILFFVCFGFATSILAGDFLDRFDAREMSYEKFSDDMIGAVIPLTGVLIAEGIKEVAISPILPIEYSGKIQLEILKESSRQNISDLKLRLKDTRKALKDARTQVVKYKSNNLSHVVNYKEQVLKIKKAIRTESSILRMNSKKLKETNKILEAAHKALISGKTNLGSGLKASVSQVNWYRKIRVASKMITRLSILTSVYFASDMLFRCGMIAFTDKYVGEKIPTIETGKYIIEKLKSGVLMIGGVEDINLELLELEIEQASQDLQ